MTTPTAPTAPEGGGSGGLADGTGDGALPAPKGRTGLYVTITVAVILGLFVVLLATRKPASDRPVHTDLVGQFAPAVSGQTLQGYHFDLDQVRGRWVVVNFFASWCAPCATEHPELRKFYDAHAKTGDATVVAVSYNDHTSDVKAFFDRNGGDWPVVLGTKGDPIGLAYGVTAPPESYLLTPDGRVYTKIVGGVTQKDLDAVLAKAKTVYAQATAPASS